MKKYFVYQTSLILNNFLFQADSKEEIYEKLQEYVSKLDILEIIILDLDADIKAFYNVKHKDVGFLAIFDILTWHKL